MEKGTYALVQKNINDFAEMNAKLISDVKSYSDLSQIDPLLFNEIRENVQALNDMSKC